MKRGWITQGRDQSGNQIERLQQLRQAVETVGDSAPLKDSYSFRNRRMKNGRAFLRFDAGGQQILNGTVFSDPASDLTCNASRSKKRSRDDEMAMRLQQQQQQILNHFRFTAPPNIDNRVANPVMISSNGLPVSCEDNRTAESVETSTSGRSTVLVSPFSQDLASFLYQQNAEIDGLIRLQNEKLRLELEATRKRHCRSLLSLLEMQVLRRLKEQEAELENVNSRSAELEEKVKQMSAENQIWFNIAMNNEAIVTNLRANLEGILLQRMGHTPKEGYGDSADGVGAIADDAQSCCYAGDGIKTGNNLPEHVPRRTCKVCRENDVSVLLLPCRHLCLCKDCESKIDTCPICKSMKNASLQIFTS